MGRERWSGCGVRTGRSVRADRSVRAAGSTDRHGLHGLGTATHAAVVWPLARIKLKQLKLKMSAPKSLVQTSQKTPASPLSADLADCANACIAVPNPCNPCRAVRLGESRSRGCWSDCVAPTGRFVHRRVLQLGTDYTDLNSNTRCRGVAACPDQTETIEIENVCTKVIGADIPKNSCAATIR
jgi:hypothetical protein